MFKLCFLLGIFIVLSGVFGKPRNSTKSTTAKPISNLLNKFHQNDYKLTFERIELVRYNKSFGEVHIRTFKYNRTTPVVNGSMIFTVDFGYNFEVVSQAYRFASNEYRYFPVRMQINVCDALDSSIAGVDKMSKFGNFACPFFKGTKYYMYNFTPEEAKFPPLIPNGQYMAEIQFVHDGQEVFVIHCYATVYRPIGWH